MKKIYFIFLLAIFGLNACLPVGKANAQTAYIANYNDSTVSVINVATNTVTATIKGFDTPWGVSVSPDGRKVYITNWINSGVVNVIDCITNTVSASIPVDSLPLGIIVSPDGNKVYVANSGSNAVSVISAATNDVAATIPVGKYPKCVAISPDGSTVYVSNYISNTVSVISTTTNTVTATINVGTFPYGISVSPDGKQVYVVIQYDSIVSVINAATNMVTATIPVGPNPMGICISPDGSKLYVANHNPVHNHTVHVINTVTNTVTATIPVGDLPMGISASPDGNKVYVANSGANSVSVINCATDTVSATIAVAVGADPCAFGNFISTYFYCSANFTIAPDTTTPHHYLVTNNASGVQPLKYKWSWGDGTFDSIAYPSHTYSAAGNYTICLTITDSTGCTSTYCDSSYNLQKSLNTEIYVDVIPQVITGINVNEFNNQITIYPNPSHDKITLDCPEKSEIAILNIQGQLLKTIISTNNKTNIDVSTFPCGVYIVKMITEKGINENKFIKE